MVATTNHPKTTLEATFADWTVVSVKVRWNGSKTATGILPDKYRRTGPLCQAMAGVVRYGA
jgi:hypothetical protein